MQGMSMVLERILYLRFWNVVDAEETEGTLSFGPGL